MIDPWPRAAGERPRRRGGAEGVQIGCEYALGGHEVVPELSTAPTLGDLRRWITEDGEVHNVFYRFIDHYIMKPTGSIDKYMADLDKKLSGPET